MKVACIGAGYFAQFQLEAWSRMPGVELIALCEQDEGKRSDAAAKYQIPHTYTTVEAMLEHESPDVVDIITPPPTHQTLCRLVADAGHHIICQKPLVGSYAGAKELADYVASKGVRMMIHENFRFQPWYREMKHLLNEGILGDTLHNVHFRMRTGDGWPVDAYMNRQPYFRQMPRLLIYETGVHYIDTFSYLGGSIKEVFAHLRKLNKDIAGEDCGLVHFVFDSGATALYDANRYNEPNYHDPRYTFGECLLETNGGSVRLYLDGKLTIQKLGEQEREHVYKHERRGFAGDCVYAIQAHFIESLKQGTPAETEADVYLQVLAVQEAIYRSQEENRVVVV